MTTLGEDGIEYFSIVIDGFDALFNRDYERFEELLENGLDINSRGPYYNTFLLLCVSNFNITSVRFLLENGIDPNLSDRNNLTPLDYVYTIPNVSVLTDDQLQRLNTIRIMLRDYGGYTSREIQILRATNDAQLRELENNIFPSENSSPNSTPSDPDLELMRNQAATQIQRRMRGRQLRQNRNYTRRNTGIQSLNPTRRERFRRFTDHNRMLDENDPLSGYLHDVYFPPKSSSKSSSKRKVAKRTKKKRNRKNRY